MPDGPVQFQASMWPAALASSEEESTDKDTAPGKKKVKWSSAAQRNTQTPGPPMAEVSVQRGSCLKRRKHVHAEGRSDARHSGSDDSDADGIAVAPAQTCRMRARVAGSARPKKNHGLMATVSPADACKSKASQHPMKRVAQARGCPELDAMMQWCASVSSNRGATGRHTTDGHDQQHAQG